jgi:predicted HTH transcriptional regulator
MNAMSNSMNEKKLLALLKEGEGLKLEFKRSTAELQGAMHSLCAFLNASGGTVVIGVGPDGKLLGQVISDATQQKIAAAFDRFEPPAPVRMEIVNIGVDKQVIVKNTGLLRPSSRNGRDCLSLFSKHRWFLLWKFRHRGQSQGQSQG